MKFIATILILSIVLASSMVMSIFGISNEVKLNIDRLNSNSNSNSSNSTTQNDLSNNYIKNAILSSTDNNKIKGLLIVKVVVNNKDIGNKTPSNFTISIHANDPSPPSFAGNSSGTTVKLGMGMYGVSESQIPGYVTSFSIDCYGGIMSVYTKQCIIINTYTTTTTSSALSK